MKTKTQKAIFLALSGVALLASTATATWVLLRQKHKVNAKNYEELKNKIKNKINLVISEKDRKDFENKINDPKYGSYSKSNGQAISDLLNNLENKINEETNEIKSVINQLNSSPIREKFLKRLDEAKDYVERKKVHDDAKLALALQKGRDINTEKAEAKKLIDKIQDQVLKDKLLKELEKADDILSVDKIKAEAEKELLSQGEKDLLKAQKDALKNKIDASKLSDTEKNKLKEKVDAATSTNFDSVNKEVNDKIKSSTDNADELLALDKKEVEDLISNVTDSSKKEELTNKLSSTSTPEEVAELKKEVEDTIKNQAFVDAKKEALIAKIDESSNLSAAGKERLKEQVNKVNDLESAIKAENDVNNAIAESNIRNKAKEVVELLKDGEIKNNLKNKLDSSNSIEDILGVIDAAEKILDDSRKEAKKVIDSIEDTNKKNALNEELAKAKTQAEIEAIKNDALNYAAYERAGKEAQSKDLDKKEAESLVDQITDPAKKQELKDQLANATTEEKINEIKEAARNEIKAQAELAANKKALKDKIDASTLDADKKNELKAKVDEATSANFDTTKSEVDAELNKDQTPEKILELNKKEAESLVDQITDPAKKQDLKDQLTNATTEEKINEIKEAARNEIKAQAELAANKKSLKDKIDASTLPENKKEELKTKVDEATSANFDATSKEVNNAILLDVLEDKTKDTINKLSDGPQKDKLKVDLKSASEPREVLEILKEAEAHLEEAKKAAEAEIEKIKDPVKKQELKSELANATTEDEYNAIKAKAEEENGTSNRKKAEDAVAKLSGNNPLKEKLLKELEDKNKSDNELEYIKNQANKALNEFKKEALASVEKTKGSQEYEGLLEKANAKNVTEDELKKIKSDADSIFNAKKEAVKGSDDLAALEESNPEKTKLNKAIESAGNILALEVISKKAEVLREIANIKNHDENNTLTLEVNAIQNATNEQSELDEKKKQLEEIKAKAALQKAIEEGDQYAIAKAKASLLPYPGGVDVPAIIEIHNKIDEIKNDPSLDTELKKLAKVKEITDTFETLTNKINEAKTEITKLSPEKQAEVNAKLNESNLIKDANINTDEEFTLLNTAISEAKAADKTNAKAEIDKLSHLTEDEKQAKKDAIDVADVDTYDEIKAIVDAAKLLDKKKDLEERAKRLPYLNGSAAQGVQDVITRINATDTEEAPTTLEKAGEFETKIGEIASELIKAKEKYDSLSEANQTEEIKTKFNEADTPEEFTELNNMLDSAIAKQNTANKKENLDRLVEALAYPNSDGNEVTGANDAQAINDIKSIYADGTNEKMDQVLNDLDRIRGSIASAKEELNKIPEEYKTAFRETEGSDPVNLIEELRKSNEVEEFANLMQKINAAKEKYKEKRKLEIDQIPNLTETNKNKFKDLINAADNYLNVDSIVENAKIEANKDLLKTIIIVSDYVDEGSSRTPEVVSLIERSINSISNSIDNTPSTDLNRKEEELRNLKTKLNELKNSINSLNDQEAKNELFKILATKTDVAGVESVKLDIKKEELRKKAKELGYPGKNSTNNNIVTAISDLFRRIENADDETKLNQLTSDIDALPDKIANALQKIDEIHNNNNISVDEANRRKQVLKDELDRADTEEEFRLLLSNIESAKTQSEQEFQAGEVNRLKERAKLLPYPAGTESAAVKSIISSIETGTNLPEWNNRLNDINDKVLDLVNKINKVSPNKQSGLNDELNSSETIEKLDSLSRKIDEILEAEKTDVANKINALENLSQDRKTSLINDLNNKSSSEMQNILTSAKREDLEAAINALPYPNQRAAAKTTLINEARSLNSNAEIEEKLAKVKELHSSISTTVAAINALPYPDGANSVGANSLKSRLNNLTEKSDIDQLVSADLSSKLEKYTGILNTTLNPFPSDAKEYGLKRRINALDGSNQQDENELMWNLYETKRQFTLNPLIDALDSLNTTEKTNLKAEAVTIPASEKTQPIADFDTKMRKLDEVILKAQKENAKAHVDTIAYPDNTSAATAINTLKNMIDQSPNLEAINARRQENESLKRKMAEIRQDIQTIRETTSLDNIRAALNRVDSLDDFTPIELLIKKARAIDFVKHELSHLNQTQKSEFVRRINEANSEDAINSIKAEASLQNKKEQIKSIIDSIGYPHPEGTEALNSKNTLKAQVQALTTDEALREKETEITALKNLIETKKTAIDSLPYPDNNAEAKNSLKAALDRATTASRVNEILPDDWSDKVEKYKNTLYEHFGRNGGLVARLNKTHPTDTTSTVSELNNQILLTKKNRAVALVNNLENLENSEKSSFNQRINAITNTGENQLPEKNKLDEMDSIYKEALVLAVSKLPQGNAKRLDLERRLRGVLNAQGLESVKTELFNESRNLKIARGGLAVRDYNNGAQDAVNNLPSDNEVRRQLQDELNNVNTSNEVSKLNNIKERAVLEKKKVDLINLAKSIAFPGGNSVPAVETLKSEINRLTSLQELSNKETKINELKSAMTGKGAAVDNLPYRNTENGRQAKDAIKRLLNSATTVAEVNRVLPSTWHNDLSAYKNIIESNFGRTHGLLDRLDQTRPDRTDDFSISNLENQVLLTKKSDKKSEIDRMSHLTDAQRNSLKAEVDAVQNTDPRLPNNANLAKIDAIAAKANAMNLAREKVNSLPANNDVKNRLLNRLNSTTLAQSEYESIKREAETEYRRILDVAKNEARTEVDKLSSSNSSKSSLTSRLNSATTLEEVNRIKEEAIAAKARDLTNERNEAIREINKIANGTFDKGRLTNEANAATSATELNSIKEEAKIANRKNSLKNEFNNLIKRDLESRGGIKEKHVGGGTGEEFIYTIENLPNLLERAKTSSELDKAETYINKQKTAELNDLTKQKFVPYDAEGRNNELRSILKSELYDDLWKSRAYKESDSRISDHTRVENLIENARTQQDYRRAKEALQSYLDTYWDKTYVDRSWENPIKNRIQSKSQEEPFEKANNGRGFNSTIPQNAIDIAKQNVTNAQDRDGGLRAERDFLKGTYFTIRRQAQLDWFYVGLVRDNILNGADRNSAYSQQVEANLSDFLRAPTIESKKNVADSLIRITGNNAFVRNELNGLFQTDIINWWVRNIADSDMNPDDKYKWINEIALITDRANALNIIRNKFIAAGFQRVLTMNNPNPHPTYHFPREFITSDWPNN
ncbi:hypothetical protein MCANPG14_02935 [Mycoplasmopsis canis PG 14]|uniref:GA module n=1 Tax=Mycoplasmopsis canis TaxID=29555 RepID=A0A449ARI7_9BACT|nr:GA module-containing protein [Mycoplasmopsis canis]AMD81522.1 hypothetical protein AXW82_03140 [Mycoplasmopsis canis PG 14]EIE39459.1 hypothetical protein MCANPG14_02935 [Mycoplasmopsis canis PG 14]VEU69153.1 GA module [Mycoplasmopsis canis]